MNDLDEQTIAAKIKDADNKVEMVAILALSNQLKKSEIRNIAVKYNVLLPWSDDSIKQAYDKGLSDSQIADAFGYEDNIVKQWRATQHLQPNKSAQNATARVHKGRQSSIDDVKARGLYDAGKSDSEIAAVFGLGSNSIWSWRKKNNLPANNQIRKKSDISVSKPVKTVSEPVKTVTKQPETVMKSPEAAINRCHCCKSEIQPIHGIKISATITVGGIDYKLCPSCAKAFTWAAELLEAK